MPLCFSLQSVFDFTATDGGGVVRQLGFEGLWHETREARRPVLPVVPAARLALPISPLPVLFRNTSGSAGGVKSTGWVDEAPLVIEEPPDRFVAAHAGGGTGYSASLLISPLSSPHPRLLRILHRGGEELLLPPGFIRVAAAAAAARAPPTLLVLSLLMLSLRAPLLAAAAAAAAAALAVAVPPLLFPGA